MSTTSMARATVVACVVALSSSAHGQLVPIFDCDEQYIGTAQTSQKGNGFHKRFYQPMLIQSEPYTVRHVTVMFGAGHGLPEPQNYTIEDLAGREATLEFLFGEYDDVNDVFVEDTSIPRPAAIPVIFGPGNLINAAEDLQFARQFDIDLAVPVPEGKKLHIGLIGFFDWLPDNEAMTVKESALHEGENPLPFESAWWVMPDDPGPPYGRALDPPAHPTGHLAMRVDAQMGVAIPTVSEWGIVAMTLLLLASGTLVYRNRASVAA